MGKTAVNVRSEKAYYEALRQLEALGYRTPIHEKPTNMHRWDVYGRETVLFIEGTLVTYGNTEYAEEKGYRYARFTPTDDITDEITVDGSVNAR